MFNLFNRDKATINSVSIPDLGWIQDKDEDGIKLWMNPEQTRAISINFFALKPDLPTTKDITTLRDFFRNQISAHNGGIVQVDLVNLKGYDAVKTIFKIPQEPTGMTYLASLTIPFAKYSYVVKIQAPEIGMTGMRDTAIVAQLMGEGKISADENGLQGWFRDPYDPTFTKGTVMNQSEEEIYDATFPNHPLSEARKLMRIVEAEIVFEKELQKIKRFW